MIFSSELNRFHKLKQKVSLLNLDIQFLKDCKKQKIFPNFIKVNTSIKNALTEKVIYNAKLNWLNLEIRHLYAKQSSLELESYNLHLKILKQLHVYETITFQEKYDKILDSIACKFEKKEIKLKEKFSNLITAVQSKTKQIMNHDDNYDFQNKPLVYNESDETFTDDEMILLKKGLQFNIPSPNNTKSAIADVISHVQFMPQNQKSKIENTIHSFITSGNFNGKQIKNKAKNNKYLNIIQSLNSRNVFYLKSDKGNAIVIINKQDYYNRVENMLKEGPYLKCDKCPLTKYIKSVKESLKSCKILIKDSKLYNRLVVTNPVMPKLYCLPKTHKQGKKMRPIVSSINSPTYLIAKWLVQQLSSLEQFPTMAIQNREEFIAKTKNIEVAEDEYMISFDVISLYPNVPMKETIAMTKQWLTSLNLDEEVINEYLLLVNLCMSQNTFLFNGEFYQQNDGTAMGNPLSCLISNIFMSNFETTLKNTLTYFPRIWIRYVDDIFAIFKKDEDLQHFLNEINTKFSSIKFTYEKELNNKIPFLDLLIIRNENTTKIEYDIYRKPTSTERYITKDSNHPPFQKKSAFNSLVYRLINTPLSNENYEREVSYIKQVAIFNGFNPEFISNLIKNTKRKTKKLSMTKLENIHIPKQQNKKWISVRYASNKLSKKIKNTFEKESDKKVTFSTVNKLKFILNNPKDKTKKEDKSGIYEIPCSNCPMKYIGQTRRNLKVRFKEHYRDLKFEKVESSAVANHCVAQNHKIQNINLLKHITNPLQLNTWESIFMLKHQKESLMNIDNPPIQNSQLLNFIT